MMYMLLIITHLHEARPMSMYHDLEDCLTKKELMVKDGHDAHCFRLEEPASTVKDLAPNTTK